MCEALIIDAFVFMPETDNDTEKFTECVKDVTSLESEFVARVSHIEKLNAKKHFRKLITEFTDKAGSIAEKYLVQSGE